MNSRVAEKIMGWELCKSTNPHAKYEEDLGWEPSAKGNYWCELSDDSQQVTPHYPLAVFTPTTDLNHAKMAWDKLSKEGKVRTEANLMQTFSQGNQWVIGDLMLDPLKLCEAMLSAVAAKGGG